ncbi:MAG TPA: methyltransferase domain-containing protein [Burkholderiales bacterium]|nr:methyltransferase domain-containing protein [Burkholderiales bacterium]
MKKSFPGIDPRAARRRFERAAATYDESSRLESEVAARMLERLDYFKIAPRRILDAASGPPRRALGKRYPGAEVIALDFSAGMLRAGKRQLFGRNPARVCGDLGRLPIAAGAVDFIWCNMALHWLSDPLPAFREFARVLVPEGLLMFSTLGPDTLKELRAAAGESRVHAFIDMHDLGDMLVAAGFSAPVMDMELLQIEYKERTLLVDLRASGQTSARADRPRGLAGRRLAERLRARLGSRATFEVVYGHAWNARKSASDGKTVRVFKRMP